MKNSLVYMYYFGQQMIQKRSEGVEKLEKGNLQKLNVYIGVSAKDSRLIYGCVY